MAFTAKILSWRFRHLNIVGCLFKRRPTKGGGEGHGHPRTPPSYAPVTNGFHYPTNSKMYGKERRYSECTFCQSLCSSLYRRFTVSNSDDLLNIKFSFFSTEREQEEMTDEFQLFKAISTRQTKKHCFYRDNKEIDFKLTKT